MFKTNWQSQRHESKKISCVPQNDREGKYCEYCMKEFRRPQNLRNHYQVCAEKGDCVRDLEIKLGVPYPTHIAKLTCRFCKYKSTTSSNLNRHIKTCEFKQRYKESLEIKLQIQQSCNVGRVAVTNNITNINNNIIQVNSLGRENTDYLTPGVLRRIWRTSKTAEEQFAKTLMIIHGNKEHPENHNIVYTNMRGNTALVKIGDSFEYRNINEILDMAGSNMLDIIVFDTKYDALSEGEKATLETLCDSELSQKVAHLAKTELYNNYKNGSVQKPEALMM